VSGAGQAEFIGRSWVWTARLPLRWVFREPLIRRLTIDEQQARLYRGRSGRDRQLVVVIDRAEVGVLEFQHGVLGPRLSGAEVRVRYDDGSYAPAVFVPVDLDGLERWLEQRGWPVTRTEWPPAHRELRARPADSGRRTEPGSVYRPAGTSTAAAVAWTVLIAVLLGGFVVGIGLGIASSAP
jgi:hypothetical protein